MDTLNLLSMHFFLLFLEILPISCIVSQCSTSDFVGVSNPSEYNLKDTGASPEPDPRGLLLKDSHYKFQCCGVVRAWEILSDNNGNIHFQVWEAIFSDQNNFEEKLKGQNKINVPNSFSPTKLKFDLAVNEQPSVYPNNYIGLRMSGLDVLLYKYGLSGFDLNYVEDYMQEVTVGDVKMWDAKTQITERTYAIKAYLGPGTAPTLTDLPASVTVSSAAYIGYSLFTPTVTDVNTMDTLVFSEFGVPSGKFNINNATGEVTIASSLAAGMYTVQVSVTDKCELKDVGTLTVYVTSQPPTVSGLPYFAYVHENDRDEKCLHTFIVNDPDGDSISCTVPSSEPFIAKPNSSLTVFAICLEGRQNLSYSTQNVYQFQVNCTDGYNYVYGDFSVYVNQNQAPNIINLPGQVTISSNTTESLDLVYNVTASDVDDVKLTFSMTCSSCPFTICQDSGQVLASKALKHEIVTSYSLLVSVSDGIVTTGPLTLTIFLTDINNTPEFTNLPHSLYILETQALGSSIYSPAARDVDVSDVLTISMTSISPVTGSALFQFDPLGPTFSVKPTATLDFEVLSDNVYNITFECDDGITTTTSYLSVYVLNVNEAPVFAASNYFLYGQEGKKGSAIGDPGFIITDQDSGDTSWTYSITGGSEAVYFAINQSSGFISYAADYDILTAESPKSVEIIVSASDSGGLTATTLLNITLTNTPRFTNLPVTVNLLEDTVSGTTVFVVSTDGDVDGVKLSTDPVTASLFLFNDSNGAVILRPGASLNYEVAQQHSLAFQSFVGTTMSEAVQLVLNIVNVNEAPIFSTSNYYIYASEGKAGDILPDPNFTITDDDVGDTHLYSIYGGTDASYFSINQTTGILSYAADYEIKQSESPKTVTLHIQLADSGGLTSQVPFTLMISNVNKVPVFVNLPLTVNLMEGSTSGTEICTVSVLDADGDSMSVVMSADVETSSLFNINVTNNMVYLRDGAIMDFERRAHYNLTFTAFDGLQSSEPSTLTVNVQDINEKPTISSSEYYVDVDEGKSGDEIPFQAGNIFDQDSGDTLKYSLIGNAYSSFFRINETTGKLSFAVDNICSKIHPDFANIDIRVSDSHNAYSDMRINLSIKPVNTKPNITNLPAIFDIPESLPSGSWIFNVFTEDPDSDAMHYKYTFTPATAVYLFSITENGKTVNVTLSGPVNYEILSIYEIEITANDGIENSTPRKLTIRVQDVAEPPAFSMATYIANVNENVKDSLIFNELIITDDDASDNVTFSLAGDSANMFYINGSGCVFFNVDYDVDKSSFDNFVTLTIKATDSTLLTATTTLQITIDDVNDNIPVPDQISHTVVVARGAPIGTTILNVNVSDADSGANSECNFTIIDSLDMVSISSDEDIVLIKSLNQISEASSFNFSVMIADKGIPSLSSSTSVTVIIKDEVQSNNFGSSGSTSDNLSLADIGSNPQLLSLIAVSAFGILMSIANAICIGRMVSKAGKIGDTTPSATNSPTSSLRKQKVSRTSSGSKTPLMGMEQECNASPDTAHKPSSASSSRASIVTVSNVDVLPSDLSSSRAENQLTAFVDRKRKYSGVRL